MIHVRKSHGRSTMYTHSFYAQFPIQRLSRTDTRDRQDGNTYIEGNDVHWVDFLPRAFSKSPYETLFVSPYKVYFKNVITRLTIISFSSGRDSAIMTVRATSV